MINENTLKSAIFHPFLIWGSPGCLGLFKSFGFKTFSNIFDESYDLIKDDSERMECILGEVKRMCDNTKTSSGSGGRDLPKDSFRSCVGIIKHNREDFRKKSVIFGKPYWIRSNEPSLTWKVIIQQCSCLFMQKNLTTL